MDEAKIWFALSIPASDSLTEIGRQNHLTSYHQAVSFQDPSGVVFVMIFSFSDRAVYLSADTHPYSNSSYIHYLHPYKTLPTSLIVKSGENAPLTRPNLYNLLEVIDVHSPSNANMQYIIQVPQT